MSGEDRFSDAHLLRMLADVITHRMPLRDVDLLVRAGVRVNGVVKNGLRPLHYAVFQNNKEVVMHLCDNGALVNFCDEVGQSTESLGSALLFIFGVKKAFCLHPLFRLLVEDTKLTSQVANWIFLP